MNDSKQILQKAIHDAKDGDIIKLDRELNHAILDYTSRYPANASYYELLIDLSLWILNNIPDAAALLYDSKNVNLINVRDSWYKYKEKRAPSDEDQITFDKLLIDIALWEFNNVRLAASILEHSLNIRGKNLNDVERCWTSYKDKRRPTIQSERLFDNTLAGIKRANLFYSRSTKDN